MLENNTSTLPWFVKRRNITLVSIAFFIFFLVITLYISFNHHQHTLEKSLKEDRSSAHLISLILDGHFQKIIKTMESYAGRPLLLQAVKDKNSEKAKKHLISMDQNAPEIDIMVITDKHGTAWAAYPERPEIMGKNFAFRDWYKGVSKAWKPYVSDAAIRVVAEKDAAIWIVVPFFDDKGNPIGILVNAQRTIEISKIIKLIHVDQGVSISICDKKGQMVYSSRYPFEKEISVYPFYPAISKVKDFMDRAIEVEDVSMPGRKRYISTAPIAEMGWKVFIGHDKHSILLSELRYYVQISSISFLLFLMTLFSAVYFRKRVMMQQAMDKLHADEALRKSEERFKLASLATNDAVWDWNLITDEIVWGEGFKKLFGYKDTEIEPTIDSWYNRVHPDDKDKVILDIHAVIKSGEQFWSDEYRFRRSDGSYSYISDRGYVIYDKNWRPVRMVGAMLDITDKKRADETLRKSEERLRLTLEATNEGIWDWNFPTGKAVFSPHYYTMLGYEPYEFPQSYDMWKSLVHPDDIEHAERIIMDHIAKGERYTIEIRLKTKTGDWRWILARGDVIERDGEGQPVRLVGTHTDINDRKKAEEEVLKLNTELEQRVRERTAQLEAAYKELEAFSYSVSHDLRAPLRGIDGFSHILLDEYKDVLDERGKNYLHRVRAGSQHLGELIDDLLKLSRVSRAEIRNEKVDLSSLARTIAEELQKTQPDRQVEFSIENNIFGRGDPNLLRIVMDNIFSNAFKFTRNNPHAKIKFLMKNENGKKVYCIHDNGVGFEMEFADKLFGAFQRLHSRSEFEGTGIGLATVQRIIHKHGGEVWAEAEAGKEATFYFTLTA